jgi:hypothetical protein
MPARDHAFRSAHHANLAVVASSLSFGSGVIAVFLFTGSPDRVSALPGRATKARIRPVIRGHQPEGAGQPVAVSCRLSATGVRFSVIRFPPGSSALLTVGLPATHKTCPDPGGVTAFRTHEQRPGWVSSIPRGQRCSPRPIALTSPRLPHHSGLSLYPAPASHLARLCFTRHQRGFKQFTRPVFPSPATARVERALLRLSPELRTPPTKSRTTHVGAGTGHRARTWKRSTTSVEPPIQRNHSWCATSRRTGGSRSGGPTGAVSPTARSEGERHAELARACAVVGPAVWVV